MLVQCLCSRTFKNSWKFGSVCLKWHIIASVEDMYGFNCSSASICLDISFPNVICNKCSHNHKIPAPFYTAFCWCFIFWTLKMGFLICVAEQYLVYFSSIYVYFYMSTFFTIVSLYVHCFCNKKMWCCIGRCLWTDNVIKIFVMPWLMTTFRSVISNLVAVYEYDA